MSVAGWSVTCETYVIDFKFIGPRTGAIHRQEAIGYIKGLMASTQDKTSLLFSEIVVVRTTLLQRNNQSALQASKANIPGPLTPKTLLAMMDYDDSIDQTAWNSHMLNYIYLGEKYVTTSHQQAESS